MGFKFVCAVVLAMAAVACAQNAQSPQSAVARSSQLFAARVYQELKGNSGNILVCPVSVQTVLALVQAGAKSETSDEIQRALFLPNDKTTTANGYEKLMSSLNNAKDVQMDIANRVYVKDGYTLNSNFKQIATKSFSAEIENLDFSKSVDAANRINHWVEQKTHDKIKDLINAGDLDSLTRMVLVNALYFKGKWVHTFDKYATKERDFWTSASTPVKVPMMTKTENFKYAENAELDCKFLEMPYTGGEYAMTIVLPNKKDGLAAVENRIAEVLQPQNYKDERVQVIMPLFEVETTIEFNDILKNMGMTKAFGPEADFSGLLDTKEQLYISKVIQKNFINVTEDGTEAASATAVDLQLRSGFLPQSQVFHAEQPFIFIIQELRTSAVIFMGRMESFEKESDTVTITTRISDLSKNAGCSSLYFQTITFVLLAKIIHFIF